MMMKIWCSSVVLLLIFTTLGAGQDQDFSMEKQNPLNESLSLQQVPDNDTSLPFVEFVDSVTEVNIGNNLDVRFGMYDEVSSLFVSGYNYSLVMSNYLPQNITNGNYTSFLENSTILLNGLTENTLQSYALSTFDGDGPIFPAGTYTITFVTNTTDRGILFLGLEFLIIGIPGPDLIIAFENPLEALQGRNPLVDVVNAEVNSPTIIDLIITNRGEGSAYNISISDVAFDQEIIFTGNPFNFEHPSINGTEFSSGSASRQIRIRLNFTVSQYTIGKLSFGLTYSDIDGIEDIKRADFPIYSFPVISAQFLDAPNDVIYSPNQNTEFSTSITTTYTGNVSFAQDLIIELGIQSDKINFGTEQQFNSQKTLYEFTGSPISSGIASLSIYLIIFDQEGNEEIQVVLLETLLEIEFVENPDETNIFNIQNIDVSVLILIFALILYLAIIIFVITLFYRGDFRNQFLKRVFGMKILDDLKFEKNTIIVDGSNVAWEDMVNGKPNMKNIDLAIQVLKENNFTDILVVTDAALRYQLEKKSDLDEYSKKGIVKVLPAKVEADGFILRLAMRNGSLILSNDLFKEYRNTYTWIDQRRVPYSIINEQLFLHPKFDGNASDIE